MTAKPSLSLLWKNGDAENEFKLEYRAKQFKRDQDSSINEFNPLAFSPWGQTHPRKILLANDYSLNLRSWDRLRFSAGVSNYLMDHNQGFDFDATAINASYDRLWGRFVSTSLGYGLRYFSREKSQFVYGPLAKLYYLANWTPWGATHFYGSVQTDYDSPNAVYLLGFELSLKPKSWPRHFPREGSMLSWYINDRSSEKGKKRGEFYD